MVDVKLKARRAVEWNDRRGAVLKTRKQGSAGHAGAEAAWILNLAVDPAEPDHPACPGSDLCPAVGDSTVLDQLDLVRQRRLPVGHHHQLRDAGDLVPDRGRGGWRAVLDERSTGATEHQALRRR